MSFNPLYNSTPHCAVSCIADLVIHTSGLGFWEGLPINSKSLVSAKMMLVGIGPPSGMFSHTYAVSTDGRFEYKTT
jgi:hypothetical protein